jgi:succinate dehydrogenase / fumarate reductase cytochrome b subunit
MHTSGLRCNVLPPALDDVPLCRRGDGRPGLRAHADLDPGRCDHRTDGLAFASDPVALNQGEQREAPMADVNRGNRPLSPHLTVYRPELNMVMSILHRITGMALGGAAVLVVWWLLAAAIEPGYFAFVDGLLTSWIGGLVMLGALASLWYHFFSGIRHLVWDTGAGFALDQVQKGGIAVLAAAGVMTVITWIAAYL